MRLILTPLARTQTLVYGQKFALPKVREKARIDDKILAKATKTWQGFEQSDTGWKKSLVKWTNKALERIPYSEWSLRTIPSINTYKRVLKSEGYINPENITDFTKIEPVKLVYPAPLMDQQQALAVIRKLADTGVPYHKKMVWRTLMGIPFTLPFAIIPIVPNIPCFYMCFRLYCHWQALQGAKHLSYLIVNHQIEPQQLAAYNKSFEDWNGKIDDQTCARIRKIFENAELNSEISRARHQIESS